MQGLEFRPSALVQCHSYLAPGDCKSDSLSLAFVMLVLWVVRMFVARASAPQSILSSPSSINSPQCSKVMTCVVVVVGGLPAAS